MLDEIYPSIDLAKKDNDRIALYRIRQVMQRYDLKMDDVVNGMLKLASEDLINAQIAFDELNSFKEMAHNG